MFSVFGFAMVSTPQGRTGPMLPPAQLAPPQMWPQDQGGDGLELSPEMLQSAMMPPLGDGFLPGQSGWGQAGYPMAGGNDGGQGAGQGGGQGGVESSALDSLGEELQGLAPEDRSEGLHAIADVLKKLHELRAKHSGDQGGQG